MLKKIASSSISGKSKALGQAKMCIPDGFMKKNVQCLLYQNRIMESQGTWVKWEREYSLIL